MNILTLRVAARFAARSSYRVDRMRVRRALRINHPDAIEDSKKYHGGYSVARFEHVPISKIKLPPIWKPSRAVRIRKAIKEGKALPPIHLGPNYEISDGIHRTNVSKEFGFTHVPAIITEWVETPDEIELPEPEKPRLDVGDWVKTREKWDGREYGWIEEQLLYAFDRRVKRWKYAVALVKRGDDWPDILDLRDSEFDPARVPSWVKKHRQDWIKKYKES